jgi:uncharacterized protein YndB with AHSA1/START domain
MDTDIRQTIGDREIVIECVFHAARNLVWAAWSEPEHLAHWWGPDGFSTSFEAFEFREGGDWRFVMHGPDNMEFPNHNIFVEIGEPERLVIDHVEPPGFKITATFEAHGSQTRLTFRQTFESSDIFESVKPYAVPGGRQTIEKLARYIQTMRG